MNPIVEFYDRSDEHHRMANTPLEYLRNKELIQRELPPGRARVLDVGGATGAFSFWLAGLGHSVTLLDLTPKHIETARGVERDLGLKLEGTVVGDARQLPFDNEEFDVVLLMGPLYHLQERTDRVRALAEARRVARPGGVVLAVTIGRYASLLDGFHDGMVADSEFVTIFQRDLETGCHRDTSSSQRYFTDAYLHLPEEIVTEFRDAGLGTPALKAVTSFGWTVPDVAKKLEDPAYRELLLATIRRVEDRPELWGASSHLMAVARV